MSFALFDHLVQGYDFILFPGVASEQSLMSHSDVQGCLSDTSFRSPRPG